MMYRADAVQAVLRIEREPLHSSAETVAPPDPAFRVNLHSDTLSYLTCWKKQPQHFKVSRWPTRKTAKPGVPGPQATRAPPQPLSSRKIPSRCGMRRAFS